MPDTGGRNECPPQGGGVLPYPENTLSAVRLRHDRGADSFPFKLMCEYTAAPALTLLRVPLACQRAPLLFWSDVRARRNNLAQCITWGTGSQVRRENQTSGKLSK